MTPRNRAYLELTIVAAIWGIATSVIKYGLNYTDPLTFLTYRFGIATILGVIVFYATKDKLPKDKKTFLLLLLQAILVSPIALGTLFWGMTKTTVLDTTLISLLQPLTVVLMGYVFLKERVTKKEKLGMAVIVVGSLIATSFKASISGNFLVYMYLITNSLAGILAKILLRRNVSPMLIVNFSFLVGFVSFLPFFLTQTPNPLSLVKLSLPVHLSVWFMAFISGTVAYWLNNRATKTIEVSETALFSYIQPVFAFPLAYYWLHESFNWYFIIGSVIVVLGLIIAESKGRKV